jgi:hypothetical protein
MSFEFRSSREGTAKALTEETAEVVTEEAVGEFSGRTVTDETSVKRS